METNVLQHMNQPNSSCYGGLLLDDFDNPTEGNTVVDFGVSHSCDMDQPCRTEELDDESPGFDLQDEDIEMHSAPLGHADGDPDTRVGPEQLCLRRFMETFKGCGKTFPGGKTFMDKFRKDQYAEERRENIYYPWASKQEWAFASWLLHSRLSIVAINSLLSLDIVSNSVSLCPIS